jgi:hypothetical protein
LVLDQIAHRARLDARDTSLATFAVPLAPVEIGTQAIGDSTPSCGSGP